MLKDEATENKLAEVPKTKFKRFSPQLGRVVEAEDLRDRTKKVGEELKAKKSLSSKKIK